MPLCPIDICDRPRLSHHVMCHRHWLLVPRELQRKILNSWGVFGTRGAKRGSDEQMEARADAVAAVNALLKEGSGVRGQGSEARGVSHG